MVAVVEPYMPWTAVASASRAVAFLSSFVQDVPGGDGRYLTGYVSMALNIIGWAPVTLVMEVNPDSLMFAAPSLITGSSRQSS